LIPLPTLTSCFVQLQWPAFERDVLHAYRRVYRLNTPSSFTKEYHHWVLTQAGSVGLHSPTIARRKDLRRQTVEHLATAVRKHFNGLGVQESDIIIDFLHKVRTQRISKSKTRKTEYIPTE
jgi:histone deacetylase complex subunit SAP30